MKFALIAALAFAACIGGWLWWSSRGSAGGGDWFVRLAPESGDFALAPALPMRRPFPSKSRRADSAPSSSAGPRQRAAPARIRTRPDARRDAPGKLPGAPIEVLLATREGFSLAETGEAADACLASLLPMR
ncbi:MAG: hypothetical protein R3F11_00400 [Verrucomicrobiales bacterium]